MSDSVQPHRWQPNRLFCPWDSPGKNTGMGCRFLLQCMKVRSLSHVRLLATPWTVAYQAPPSMGFSRQQYWSGSPLPSLKSAVERNNKKDRPYTSHTTFAEPHGYLIYYAFDHWEQQFCFSSIQSLSHVWLFATPWIAAHQASLSITNCWSSLKLMSIKSVMPSSHLILCCPLLLLPPIPPSSRVSKWVNSSHEVAKVLELQLQNPSFQWTPRTDLL